MRINLNPKSTKIKFKQNRKEKLRENKKSQIKRTSERTNEKEPK